MSEFKKGDKVTLDPRVIRSRVGSTIKKSDYYVIFFLDSSGVSCAIKGEDLDYDCYSVNLTDLKHYKEPKMTLKERIANMERELAELKKLEDEELDYDPLTWEPDEGEDYFALHAKDCYNGDSRITQTHKQAGAGRLFKKRSHAEAYLKQLGESDGHE